MKSEIKIEIGLDEKQQPESIFWEADSDKGVQRRWTTKLQVAEMDRLMFHTLRALSDTYYNATKNEELSNQMRSFVDHFGKSTKIIPNEN